MKRYLDQKLRLQLLRVVDALEVHGSLLKASAALGVSQPALTKSLKDIEELVGTRLFERHARGVRPTESGMVLVRSGRRILAELKRTEEDLDHLANPFGGIAAIGALPVAASGLVPLVLTKLRKQNPDFKVRVEEGRTEELLPLLAAGQIDLIVGRFYEPPMPDNFQRDQLWIDPMAFVARMGHPLLEVDALTPERMRGYDLVLPVAPQRVASEIEGLLAPLGLDQASTIWSTSYEFTREILLLTDAITIVPPMVMLSDINRGMLGTRALPIQTPTRPAGMITARGRKLNGAALAFIECLQQNISEIVDTGLANIPRKGRP
jgi:LysR family transcriptional regulator, pca operon transcriptional activator